MRKNPKDETQIGSSLPVQKSIGFETEVKLKSLGIKSPKCDNLILIVPGFQIQNNTKFSDKDFRVKMLKKYKLNEN